MTRGRRRQFRKQFKMLQEFPARLVADVVTGKLDVREAVRDLPRKPLERNGQ